MIKKITIICISLILLSGCALISSQNTLKGDYKWTNKEIEKLYSNLEWTPITTKKLEGFGFNDNISEKHTEECISYENDISYLRTEGGMCGTGYWLEIIKENSEVFKIDSLEKLKQEFTPIETSEQAISFLSAIESDLKFINEIPLGQVATIKEGYLVQLIHENTFGCGTHQPTGIVIKISTSGEIENLAFEKEPFSLEPEICID